MPQIRAWVDDDGRIMVLATHNTDVGDGWEHEAYGEWYFETFSTNSTRIVTRRIAQGIAARLGLSYSATALTKIKNTSELKSVADLEARKELLRNAFQVDKKQVKGTAVLLVDDVYRSGATLESAAEAVATQGNPKALYVLALTRTRVHR